MITPSFNVSTNYNFSVANKSNARMYVFNKHEYDDEHIYVSVNLFINSLHNNNNIFIGPSDLYNSRNNVNKTHGQIYRTSSCSM